MFGLVSLLFYENMRYWKSGRFLLLSNENTYYLYLFCLTPTHTHTRAGWSLGLAVSVSVYLELIRAEDFFLSLLAKKKYVYEVRLTMENPECVW